MTSNPFIVAAAYLFLQALWNQTESLPAIGFELDLEDWFGPCHSWKFRSKRRDFHVCAAAVRFSWLKHLPSITTMDFHRVPALWILLI